MKTKQLLLIASMAITLALTGCHGSQMKVDLFDGGPSADEVRSQLVDSPFDVALIFKSSDQLEVSYTNIDSSYHFSTDVYYNSDSNYHEEVGYDFDYSVGLTWQVVWSKKGFWRMKITDIPSAVLNIKLFHVQPTPDGATFDVELYGIKMAECQILTSRTDLLSDSLLGQPELKPILCYAIIERYLRTASHISDSQVATIKSANEAIPSPDLEENYIPRHLSADELTAHNQAIDSIVSKGKALGFKEVNYLQFEGSEAKGVELIGGISSQKHCY